MAETDLYIFDDPVVDQERLRLQAQVACVYVRSHAARFLPTPPRRILDLGCGGGFISTALHECYPDATLVGVDRSPVALATARAQFEGTPNISFVQGDIQEALPPGPFDLIYASLVLVHVPQLARVLEHVYAALAPGGTFWVKDMHPDLPAAGRDPDYRYLWQVTLEASQKIGGHPQIAAEVLALLPTVGFTDIRVEEDECYPLGGSTPEGIIGLADLVAVFRNSRGMVSRMTGVAEDEILRHCDRVVATAQASPDPLGTVPLVNILARRPVT